MGPRPQRWSRSYGGQIRKAQRSSREYDLRCLDGVSLHATRCHGASQKNYERGLRQFTTVLLPPLRYTVQPDNQLTFRCGFARCLVIGEQDLS